ncbi:MAG: S-layer homology domain-containing protein [Chloroflexia bacterium]
MIPPRVAHGWGLPAGLFVLLALLVLVTYSVVASQPAIYAAAPVPRAGGPGAASLDLPAPPQNAELPAGNAIPASSATHEGTCTLTSTPTITPTRTGTPPTATSTVCCRSHTPTPRDTPTSTPTDGPCVQPVREDFESGSLGIFRSSGVPAWTVVQDSHSGIYAAYAPDLDSVTDLGLTLSDPIPLPLNATAATLTFYHRYDLEGGQIPATSYDGAVVEVSTDGGTVWLNPLISPGGYSSTLYSCPSGNPLAGRFSWSGSSGGWVPVSVDLLRYRGQSLIFRFRLGTDQSGGAGGWWIDDVNVSITQSFCFSPTPALTATSTRPALTNTITATRSPILTPTPTGTRPTATATCSPAWGVVPSSGVGPYINLLIGVAAAARDDVWTVGYYSRADMIHDTIVGHWNGSSWTVVPNPNPGPFGNELWGVAAVSPGDVWAVGYSGISNSPLTQTLTEHWNGMEWSVVPGANTITGSNFLYGVDAVAANDVWAVGDYIRGTFQNATYQPLIEHWNGTQWSLVPAPDLGTRGSLNGVSALSATDVWAVGSKGSQTLAEHWDGTQWSVVPSPNIGSGPGELSAVTAVSAHDVWAVGSSGSYGNYRTLILHWDGNAWSVVPSPSPGTGNNQLGGVAAVSANDVWAVGYSQTNNVRHTLVLHWNGTVWRVASSPSPDTLENQLWGVAALSSNDLLAVGWSRTSGPYSTLVERYYSLCPPATPTGTGTPPTATRTPSPAATCPPAWSIVPSTNPGNVSNYLSGAAAVSTNDVWAVGSSVNGGGVEPALSLVEHWNGCGWVEISSPNPGTTDNSLHAVAVVLATDIWAVGSFSSSGPYQTLVERWDGSGWSVVPSPNTGPGDNNLLGVTAISADDAWAVGYYLDAQHVSHALTEHWDGVLWSIVSGPAGAPNSGINAVSAVSADDVWAVGDYIPTLPGPGQTLTAHWDGSSWSLVPSANRGSLSNVLRGVAAVSTNDVWAVGVAPGLGSAGSLVEHWDGSSWSLVASPSPGGSRTELWAVAALSAGDIWAVGHYYSDNNDLLTLAEHWNGSSWSVISSPSPTSFGLDIFGVAPVSAYDAWMVGNFNGPTSSQTLTLHYSNRCATPTPGPSSTPAPPAPSPTPLCPGERFSDVCPADYFYAAVNDLAGRGVISGYADGTFKPYNLTTRGQLCKIVVLSEGWAIYSPISPKFSDVPVCHAFYAYVETAYKHGVISGYGCGEGCLAFRPENNVTRGQLCKIVALALGWPAYTPPTPTFRDVPSTQTFYSYIETAYSHSVISGYQCGVGCLEFRPGNNATRGQISKIVYLAVNNPRQR